ncbi:MAG: metallophosphoesterase family protein [Balneolaceae bacterium]
MPKGLIAIGDIHGCYNSLVSLIDTLSIYNNYTFVFLGDYIDRGVQSGKVIDYLIGFGAEKDAVFLRGNHEQMMLDALDSGDLIHWFMNGGQSTIESYGTGSTIHDIPDEHIRFIRATKLHYDTTAFFFAHAGAPVHQTIEESIHDPDSQEYFLWGRDHISTENMAWEKPVVFGHTPMQKPLLTDLKIGIDTGCVYSSEGYGTLTAVVLPERTIIQQPSLD